MRTNKIYNRAKIILVLALFSIFNAKGQSIAEVLSKSKKAYDTANIVTDSKTSHYNTMNPDTTPVYGKLYYRIEPSGQHFLLESDDWNFIRNNKYFGYNNIKKKEYEPFEPKDSPPYLIGWQHIELLLPFLNDTAFFYGRFKAQENVTISMDENGTHYILKKHRSNPASDIHPSSEIEITYFINKKTFLIESTVQSGVATDGTGFELRTLTWYKYSPTSKQEIINKIDGFIPYPSKLKLKD
jgi:hypothetical protein